MAAGDKMKDPYYFFFSSFGAAGRVINFRIGVGFVG